MIILFDGVDKTGKTTLSTMLHKYNGYEYRKHSTMHSAVDALMASTKVLKDITSHKTYIFDRFYFPSDAVYGPIVGGYELSPFVRRGYSDYVIPLLREHHAVFIHCTASDEVLAERFIREKEEYASVKQIQAIAAEYRKIAESNVFDNVITLDSTNDAPGELYEQLITQLAKWGVR